MAQQYDPVTWRNVTVPDNQASLIKMAADRSNLLNDVINSFQARDKQILDRNVSNLNAMEAYNTKEQSAKIIQALSGVANPSADGAKMLADTVSRLDPNMPINKAELFNTGFNAIDKLAGQIKTNLGIQQAQNEQALNQGKINASTESLISMGVLPKGTQPDPSHVALYDQAIQQQEQKNRDSNARAALIGANASANQVVLAGKRLDSDLASAELTRQKTLLELNQDKKKVEQDRLLAEVNNAFNNDKPINPASVEAYEANSGDTSKLVQLGIDKYFQLNPDQKSVVTQSTALNKIIDDYNAKSGAASAEEMEYFSNRKNATFQNMVSGIKEALVKNGYKPGKELDTAVEEVIHLTRGIVDHKNATEYNHNLFTPSGNEATDPETVVLNAANNATGLYISRLIFNKQAKAANDKARAFSTNRLLGKNP